MPHILGLFGFSRVDESKTSNKRYFLLTQAQYPSHAHHTYKCLLIANDQSSSYWDNLDSLEPFSPSKASFNSPISTDLLNRKPYRKTSSHDFIVDDIADQELFEQIKKDVAILHDLHISHYSLVFIAAVRDKVHGNLFLPGSVFGPESEEERRTPLERRATLPARHDYPLDLIDDEGGIVSGGSLLPPPHYRDEKRNTSVYFTSVEFIHINLLLSENIMWPSLTLQVHLTRMYARDS